MKPFEEWVKELPIADSPTWQQWEDEGHGLLKESGFMITCCCCENDFAVSDFIGPEEFDPDTRETFYCGGSQWCCP